MLIPQGEAGARRRWRRMVLAGVFLAAAAAPAKPSDRSSLATLFAVQAAPPASALLRSLHGRWQGDGIDILIDTERMQGNTNPQKPFGRDPFVIRDVTPPWVVFVIGPSTFVAQIEGEAMTLTQPGWPGSRTVLRVPASRPSPLRGTVEPAQP